MQIEPEIWAARMIKKNTTFFPPTKLRIKG